MLKNYKILVASERSPLMDFAVQELQDFLHQSTGVSLSVVNEIAEEGLYISIGETALSQKVDLSVLDSYNTSGFVITMVGNSYVILGKSEHGTLYGIYELLKRWIGLEVYAEEEIYYEKNAVVDLKPIEYTYCPKITYRHVNVYSYWHPLFANRMKTFTGGYYMNGDVHDWYFKFWGGGMFAHTTYKILPPEKDENGELIHKDWYSADAKQLCFTNPEAESAFIEKFKDHILKYQDSPYFGFGIEDCWGSCECPTCAESHKKYGGVCGTYIRFVGRVARAIDDWRKEVLPDKNFKLVIFAYLWTRTPPVKMDEAGRYIPYAEDMVLPENVILFNAPIDMCGYHTYDAPCNKDVAERFEKWKVYTTNKDLFVWDYHCYYDYIMIFFPSLWNYKSNIKFYEKNNVIFVYNEVHSKDYNTGFLDLKGYMLAKLLWNSDEDQEFLIRDFCEHYYKEASENILTVLDKLKKHYSTLEKEYALLGGRGYHVSYDVLGHPDVLTQRHWPEKFLLELEELFEDGIKKVVDSAIKLRVKRDMVFVKYLLIELHTYYCDHASFKKRVDEFKSLIEELGITNFTHWYNQKKNPKGAGKIQDYYSKLACRYPARDSQAEELWHDKV